VTEAGSGVRLARDRTGTSDRLQVLLPAARQVIADLAGDGEPASRDRLAELLRTRGYTLSNAQAGRLLTRLSTTPAEPS
jgi:hypothetical protein